MLCRRGGGQFFPRYMGHSQNDVRRIGLRRKVSGSRSAGKQEMFRAIKTQTDKETQK